MVNFSSTNDIINPSGKKIKNSYRNLPLEIYLLDILPSDSFIGMPSISFLYRKNYKMMSIRKNSSQTKRKTSGLESEK